MSQQSNAGIVIAIGPDEGASFWQPKPANGYVRTLLNSKNIGASTAFSSGTQTVDPGCWVREHFHDHHEEIIYIYEGTGIVKIDGIEQALCPGTCLFLGKERKHSFHNTGTEPLSFFWTLMPGGLDEFFAEIGQQRTSAAEKPEPFDRPANIAEIEARTVFGWTQKS